MQSVQGRSDMTAGISPGRGLNASFSIKQVIGIHVGLGITRENVSRRKNPCHFVSNEVAMRDLEHVDDSYWTPCCYCTVEFALLLFLNVVQ
jgi:hypothetical protein